MPLSFTQTEEVANQSDMISNSVPCMLLKPIKLVLFFKSHLHYDH